MSGSPLGVSLLSRILVPWAIILIALQSLQLKFLLILWVCVLVLISVQQISLKLSGSTLYQSLIISHSYYSQELRSHSAGWFSPRVSHKVAARWWLWLGSSQMLLYSHIWYLACNDSDWHQWQMLVQMWPLMSWASSRHGNLRVVRGGSEIQEQVFQQKR